MIAYIRLLNSQEKCCGMMYLRPVVVLRMAPLWSVSLQYLQRGLLQILAGLGVLLRECVGVGLYLSLEETNMSLRFLGREWPMINSLSMKHLSFGSVSKMCQFWHSISLMGGLLGL